MKANTEDAVEEILMAMADVARGWMGADERAWQRIEAGDVPKYDEVKR